MHRLAGWAAALLFLGACGSEKLVSGGTQGPVTTTTSSTPPPDAGKVDACHTDCDCAAGTRCQAAQGEAPAQCVPGTNTCPLQCLPACGANQQCNTATGQCETVHCPSQITCGPGYFCDTNGNCQATPPEVNVNGVWKTTYTMDVHQFAQAANTVLIVLDLLDALFNGTGSCANQATPEGQLLCYILQLTGASIQAPAWVGQLLTTLEDLFKFGSSPVTAVGQMTLTQGTHDTLAATETWSSLLVNYNGQVLDLMNSPALASAGQVTVTVQPFAGTRDYHNVYLGPRDVELDVDHFLIALVDVAISAATNGQATDIAGVLRLAICNQITTPASQLACDLAADQLAQTITASSGLGGFHVTQQDAPIIDSHNTGTADGLALPTAPAALVGSMSNGVVSGGFGPTSSWYGTR